MALSTIEPSVCFHNSNSRDFNVHQEVSRECISREWISGAPQTSAASEAYRLVRAGVTPVLILGPAGTGKTTFLKQLIHDCGDRVVAVAPTGVAALRLDGYTIHSVFKLPPRVITPDDTQEPAAVAVLRAMEVLVIDEISMVRADVLDAIDSRLRCARRDNRPFGGVQVVMLGDPFQLPPVVEDDAAATLDSLGYSGPWFFDATVMTEALPTVVHFDHVYRQDDPTFVRVLHAIRRGDANDEVLSVINGRVYEDTEALCAEANVVTLTARRAHAREINAHELRRLPEPEREFRSMTVGDFPAELQRTESVLRLRKHSRVMFVKNDPDHRWVNGTVGTVVGRENNVVLVRADGASDVHRVRAVSWERTRLEYDRFARRFRHRVVGSFTQLPIAHAWATTVHKAQGITLERAHVALDGVFATGQTYVALSRCRSLNGLTLERAITSADIRVDARVTEYLESLS